MANAVEVLKARPQQDETIEIGLAHDYRGEMAKDLTEILAATYKLVIKTHVYHWNVVGPVFKPIHELTEEHYNALFEAVDIVAERIRALGHLAPVDFGAATQFSPKPGETDHSAAIEMVRDLIADHETSVRDMRRAAIKADGADDVVTADMLTDRLAFHEKALWMLRAIATS